MNRRGSRERGGTQSTKRRTDEQIAINNESKLFLQPLVAVFHSSTGSRDVSDQETEDRKKEFIHRLGFKLF